MAKGGGWITINGTHVQINGAGKIVAGPARLTGGGGGSNSEGSNDGNSKSKSGGGKSSTKKLTKKQQEEQDKKYVKEQLTSIKKDLGVSGKANVKSLQEKNSVSDLKYAKQRIEARMPIAYRSRDWATYEELQLLNSRITDAIVQYPKK